MQFVVYGEPKAKGRPRFRTVGKFTQAYTDKETTNYENLVKLCFINSGCEAYLNDEPLRCCITLYKSIPTSASKKKQNQMANKEIRPTGKPDLDNCIKSILDGLNKVAFKDDKQIVELCCSKYYDYSPRAEIFIEKIGGVENE